MKKTINLRLAVIDPQFAEALHAFADFKSRFPATAFDDNGQVKGPALVMKIGPAMMNIEQLPCYGKFDIQYKSIEIFCDEFGEPLPGYNDEFESLKKMGWQDTSDASGTIDINKITLAALHTIGNSPFWERELAEYKSNIKQMADAMSAINRPRIGCCTILVLILTALVLGGSTAIGKCL